ncbi:MAG TPA: HNH endonuclease [Planctomycetota bacterium]|nr:HNH endonuclease [Planctomycetota bacterium]
MAEAAEAIPEVAARVVEARITPQKAAIVNEVLKRPELQRPGEDLLAFVESRWAKDLVNEVKRRKEEARLGEPPVALTIQVSAHGRDDFRRCQTLVSRSLDRMATEGETLERVCDDFLLRHDPEKKARRFEDNDKAKASLKVGGSEHPLQGAVASERSRHVPAVDTRELLRAAGDRCWVDGCGNEAFLQMAHRRAFRANGSNTSRNLLRLCRTHHGQFDEGLWRLVRRLDGQVVLIDRRGVRVGRLRDEAAAFVVAHGRAPP